MTSNIRMISSALKAHSEMNLRSDEPTENPSLDLFVVSLVLELEMVDSCAFEERLLEDEESVSVATFRNLETECSVVVKRLMVSEFVTAIELDDAISLVVVASINEVVFKGSVESLVGLE